MEGYRGRMDGERGRDGEGGREGCGWMGERGKGRVREGWSVGEGWRSEEQREGGEGGRVDRGPWRSCLPSSRQKRLCHRHPARNLSRQLHRDCTSTIRSIRMVIFSAS